METYLGQGPRISMRLGKRIVAIVVPIVVVVLLAGTIATIGAGERGGLPPQLTEAIEQKQKADHESQRMEFILTKKKQEAERKRIEAQGIADFQRIVAAGIREQLLRWKGIEATLKISESSNSKVVIIGSGKDGLPIILGSQ